MLAVSGAYRKCGRRPGKSRRADRVVGALEVWSGDGATNATVRVGGARLRTLLIVLALEMERHGLQVSGALHVDQPEHVHESAAHRSPGNLQRQVSWLGGLTAVTPRHHYRDVHNVWILFTLRTDRVEKADAIEILGGESRYLSGSRRNLSRNARRAER